MNPVYSAELRYQDYLIRTNRSSTLWILAAMLLLLPALLTALYLTVASGLFGIKPPALAMFSVSESAWDTLYNVGIVALITMNFAHYLVLALVSSGFAIFSIQREYRNRTWDILVLTGLNARQIAFGKIRASIWMVRRDFYMVTLLRIGLVAFLLHFITPFYPDATFSTGQFMLLAALVIGWTFFDVVLSISAAVSSALMPHGRSVLVPSALFVRALVVFGGIWWLAVIIDALYRRPDTPDYVVIGVVGLVIFGVIAAVSLKVAEAAARIAHASPVKISQNISQ